MLITPYDLLLPAGLAATLEVELERRVFVFVDPAVADREVVVEGYGSARSGPSGIASIPLGVLAPGSHKLTVRVGSKRSEALIRVIAPEAPIIVVDIDQTIADVTPQGFILRKVQDVAAMPGAPEALGELSKSMQILYLSARDHIFTRKTKIWLRAARFPEAPVYLRKGSRFWSASPREHKIQRLAELRPKFPNMRWGIGDKPGDAAAYLAHSIRPILLGRSRPPEVSTDVPCLPDWKRIVEMVKRG